jgi:hypothetical protein
VSASVEVPLVDGPGPAIQRIAQALMDAGWGVDHPPGKPNHLWIRTLPDAREPHALLLTIGYASSSPAAPGFSWTLAVTDED